MAPGVHVAWLHGVALIVLILAACYEPRFGECVVRCAADSHCAPTQICGGDGWCASAGQAGRCFLSQIDDAGTDDDEIDAAPDARPADAGAPDAVIADAAPVDAGSPMDAAMPDAGPPTCGSSCPGTCLSGVCIIACIAPGSCEDGVVCPASGPCTVLCTGSESCRGEVQCGAGRCTVMCQGAGSCKKGVDCEGSCACNVSCSATACEKASKCPGQDCKAGKGCTSQPSGCSTC